MLTRRQLLHQGITTGLFGKALASSGANLPAASTGIELMLQSRDAQGRLM